MSELVDNIAIVRNIATNSDLESIYSSFLQEMIDNINRKYYGKISTKFTKAQQEEFKAFEKYDQKLRSAYISYKTKGELSINKRKLKDIFDKYIKIYLKLKNVTGFDKTGLIIANKDLLNEIQEITDTFVNTYNDSGTFEQSETLGEIASLLRQQLITGAVTGTVTGELTKPSYIDNPFNAVTSYYEAPQYALSKSASLETDYDKLITDSRILHQNFFSAKSLKEKEAELDRLKKSIGSTKSKISNALNKLNNSKDRLYNLEQYELEKPFYDELIILINNQIEGYKSAFAAEKYYESQLAIRQEVARREEATPQVEGKGKVSKMSAKAKHTKRYGGLIKLLKKRMKK
jgi:hypothetical protein